MSIYTSADKPSTPRGPMHASDANCNIAPSSSSAGNALNALFMIGALIWQVLFTGWKPMPNEDFTFTFEEE